MKLYNKKIESKINKRSMLILEKNNELIELFQEQIIDIQKLMKFYLNGIDTGDFEEDKIQYLVILLKYEYELERIERYKKLIDELDIAREFLEEELE